MDKVGVFLVAFPVALERKRCILLCEFVQRRRSWWAAPGDQWLGRPAVWAAHREQHVHRWLRYDICVCFRPRDDRWMLAHRTGGGAYLQMFGTANLVLDSCVVIGNVANGTPASSSFLNALF